LKQFMVLQACFMCAWVAWVCLWWFFGW